MDFDQNEYCIVDMVASTDTFSNSLHLQFDAILLVTEPTKESVDLAKKYLTLAHATGVAHLIHIVGNKIMDDEDVAFIKQELSLTNLPYLPMDNNLKKNLRNGMSILTYFQSKS